MILTTCVAPTSDELCSRRYSGKSLPPSRESICYSRVVPVWLHSRHRSPKSGPIRRQRTAQRQSQRFPFWFPWRLIRILISDLCETMLIACDTLLRSPHWFTRSSSLLCKVLAARWVPVIPSKFIRKPGRFVTASDLWNSSAIFMSDTPNQIKVSLVASRLTERGRCKLTFPVEQNQQARVQRWTRDCGRASKIGRYSGDWRRISMFVLPIFDC